MNRLLEIGFVPAGHWILEDDKLKFELTRLSTQKNILYAFVCDGQVKYVGKTIRALAIRMSGYKTPGITQTTNINNHRRIKELLSLRVAVEILALPDNGLLHYGQFHLNLAAALEDAIVRVINPEWNGGKAEEKIRLSDIPTTGSEPPAAIIGTFSFTLQPTYYRSGFFNVGVSSQKYLGSDGETIELFLGDGINQFSVQSIAAPIRTVRHASWAEPASGTGSTGMLQRWTVFRLKCCHQMQSACASMRANQAAGGNAGERRSSARSDPPP